MAKRYGFRGAPTQASHAFLGEGPEGFYFLKSDGLVMRRPHDWQRHSGTGKAKALVEWGTFDGFAYHWKNNLIAGLTLSVTGTERVNMHFRAGKTDVESRAVDRGNLGVGVAGGSVRRVPGVR